MLKLLLTLTEGMSAAAIKTNTLNLTIMEEAHMVSMVNLMRSYGSGADDDGGVGMPAKSW